MQHVLGFLAKNYHDPTSFRALLKGHNTLAKEDQDSVVVSSSNKIIWNLLSKWVCLMQLITPGLQLTKVRTGLPWVGALMSL